MRALAGFVPFGFPEYPRELLDRFVKESERTIRELGIDIVSTSPVIIYDDAQRALSDIYRKDLDFIITVILSWIEAPNFVAVLRDFFNKPILLWSHTMFKAGGEWLTLGPLPGAAVIRETLEQMGAKFKFVWGMPDSERVKREIISFAIAANALQRLSKSKIGLLGYAALGMYTATFDHVSVRNRIGPEIDQLDQYVLIKKVEEVDGEEVERLMGKAKRDWKLTENVTDEDLRIAMKMYLALKNIIKEFGWDALTVKCQYELSRYYKFTPCVPLSMLGDEVPCSCEGDIPLTITQLMLHYLTGKTVTYVDIHNITDKTVLIGACGFAPFKLGLAKPEIDKMTMYGYHGLLNSTVYKRGKVTLARLASAKNGYKMHIETGKANVPEPFHEVGCQQYPSMEVTLDGDTYHFGQHLMSQHYALVYSDIKNELLELCRLLDIKCIVSG